MIGCGGSGKTTLANELGRTLELPVVHIDAHLWRTGAGPGGEAWTRTHSELVAGNEWVVDGMKLGLLPDRLELADTVVFLDVPTRTCVAGIVLRRVRYHWRPRPDTGAPDRLSRSFVRWVLSFRRVQRHHVLALLDAYRGETIVISSWTEARRLPARLAEAVPEPVLAATGR